MVCRSKIRRNVVKMEIGPVVEDGAADGDAHSTAEIAHHVEQAAGVFEPLRRQAAETQRNTGGDGEYLRKTAKNQGNHEFCRTPVMGDGDETPHGEAEAGKSEHHQPSQVISAGQRYIDRHTDQ